MVHRLHVMDSSDKESILLDQRLESMEKKQSRKLSRIYRQVKLLFSLVFASSRIERAHFETRHTIYSKCI